jgi:hypothetical protein
LTRITSVDGGTHHEEFFTVSSWRVHLGGVYR